MGARFHTKVTKARFVVSPFSPQVMETGGNEVVESIHSRLSRAQDANDAPAPPLKQSTKVGQGKYISEGILAGSTLFQITKSKTINGKWTNMFQSYTGYALWKQTHGLKPIRDWLKTGALRRSIKTLAANNNKVTVGFAFNSQRVRDYAYTNQSISHQWGLSKRNLGDFVAYLNKNLQSIVGVKKGQQ